MTRNELIACALFFAIVASALIVWRTGQAPLSCAQRCEVGGWAVDASQAELLCREWCR